MQHFTIYTAGPVIRKSFRNLTEARGYVEANCRLRRGWVGKWDGEFYRRYNSKGTEQKSYAVRLCAR